MPLNLTGAIATTGGDIWWWILGIAAVVGLLWWWSMAANRHGGAVSHTQGQASPSDGGESNSNQDNTGPSS